MELMTFTVRILVAFAAGLFIGLERELQQKKAGLRTHSLVAVGSAVFVLISLKVSEDISGDPTRIIGQVVTGIGFIGAGVILHQGLSVRGLTTAASIWCSAAIGCLAAAGYYLETAIATFIIVFINFALRGFDERIEAIFRKKKRKEHKKELD
jgi:putative Mg2+ transporter-C (MgtC) family protein